MLNMISSYEMTPVEMIPVEMTSTEMTLEVTLVEVTQKPLSWFGLGACQPVPVAAATASKGAVASRRPSTGRTAPVAPLGQHCALTVSGRRGNAAGSSAASDKQFTYNTTLTIADGAGDLGPHPAREPV